MGRHPDARAGWCDRLSALTDYCRRSHAAGLRFVVTAPEDVCAFARGIRLFPERIVSSDEHAFWTNAYHRFRMTEYSQRAVDVGEMADMHHDAGSWRILAVDANEAVVGAVTTRIFCGEILPEYMYDLTLIQVCELTLRADYQIAIGQLVQACRRQGVTFGEVSNWAVSAEWKKSPAGVALIVLNSALCSHFTPHCGLAAANLDSGAFDVLAKIGALPIVRYGNRLPPFFHPAYRARLGFLELSTQKFAPRFQVSEADRRFFRESISMYSRA